MTDYKRDAHGRFAAVDNATKPELVRLLDHHDPEVRTAAEKRMREIGMDQGDIVEHDQADREEAKVKKSATAFNSLVKSLGLDPIASRVTTPAAPPAAPLLTQAEVLAKSRARHRAELVAAEQAELAKSLDGSVGGYSAEHGLVMVGTALDKRLATLLAGDSVPATYRPAPLSTPFTGGEAYPR